MLNDRQKQIVRELVERDNATGRAGGEFCWTAGDFNAPNPNRIDHQDWVTKSVVTRADLLALVEATMISVRSISHGLHGVTVLDQAHRAVETHFGVKPKDRILQGIIALEPDQYHQVAVVDVAKHASLSVPETVSHLSDLTRDGLATWVGGDPHKCSITPNGRSHVLYPPEQPKAGTVMQIGTYVHGNVSGGKIQSTVGDHNTVSFTSNDVAAVVAEMTKQLGEIADHLRDSLPIEEAADAAADADAVRAAISEKQPNGKAILAKARKLGSTIARTADRFIDSTDKVDSIANAVTKWGQWLLLLKPLMSMIGS